MGNGWQVCRILHWQVNCLFTLRCTIPRKSTHTPMVFIHSGIDCTRCDGDWILNLQSECPSIIRIWLVSIPYIWVKKLGHHYACRFPASESTRPSAGTADWKNYVFFTVSQAFHDSVSPLWTGWHCKMLRHFKVIKYKLLVLNIDKSHYSHNWSRHFGGI